MNAASPFGCGRYESQVMNALYTLHENGVEGRETLLRFLFSFKYLRTVWVGVMNGVTELFWMLIMTMSSQDILLEFHAVVRLVTRVETF